MRANRSIPSSTVIPELGYPDPGEAAAWLAEAFGFAVRVKIANHRVQMSVGEGALVITEQSGGAPSLAYEQTQRVLIRVLDIDAHCRRAKAAGARILSEPHDLPFGERQYNAEDFAGRRWTFSQTIADVAPETWGGESVKL
jgi:uncharacterized glyoxalase superfamily protein PhnB